MTHFDGPRPPDAGVRRYFGALLALPFGLLSLNCGAIAQSGNIWAPQISIPVEAYYLHADVKAVTVFCGIFTTLDYAQKARNLDKLQQGGGLIGTVRSVSAALPLKTSVNTNLASSPVASQRAVNRTLTVSFQIDRAAALKQGLRPYSTPGWRCELYVSNGKTRIGASIDASTPEWARATDTAKYRFSSTGTF